jgi:hypothetical protein
MCNNRITSYDQGSFIEFDPTPELSRFSFNIKASLKGRNISCNSLSFMGFPVFLAELKKVVSSWSGQTTLYGTYDFEMTIKALSPAILSVEFVIIDYIEICHNTMRHILQGAFTVEEAQAQRLPLELSEIFSFDQ